VAWNTSNPTTLFVDANGTLVANYVPGFNISFNETGLILGTQWSLSLGSPLLLFSTSNQLSVFEPNGSYNYTITAIPGFTCRSAGFANVTGHPVTVNVTFISILYEVTFLESGLPSETSWAIIVHGVTTRTLAPYLSVDELNGTYSFVVMPPSGYVVNIASGELTVKGQSQSISLTFSRAPTGTSFSGEDWIVGGVAILAVAVAAVSILWRRRSQ
jgi:hypothetical protein